MVGAVIWVGVVRRGRLPVGNVPIVKKNFSLVMLGIIVVSVLPAAYEFLKHDARTRSRDRVLRSRRGGHAVGREERGALATWLTMAYILVANRRSCRPLECRGGRGRRDGADAGLASI